LSRGLSDQNIVRCLDCGGGKLQPLRFCSATIAKINAELSFRHLETGNGGQQLMYKEI